MASLTKHRDGWFKRGNSWLRIMELPSEDGKRRQKWIYGRTQAEVRAKVKATTAAIQTGTYVPPSKASVADLLEAWLDHCATRVRPITLRGYRSNVSKLKESIGNVKASDLKPEHLSKLYADTMSAGNVSAYVVVNMHRVVSEALNYAMSLNLVSRNVAHAVKPPRPRKAEKVTVDAVGVAQLLWTAEDSDLRTVIALTLATGLRRSEVLGLQWRDIDLSNGEAHVRRGLHVLKGELIYEAPKSATSRRTVALPPSACVLLRAHRESMEAAALDLGVGLQPEHHLFVRADFKPMLPDYVSHTFNRLVHWAGLDGLRFHDLRHSHATLMLEQGVHPKVVSDRLGHSSIGITLDLYSHPGMDLQRRAAEAFDAALTDRAGEKVQTSV